jgi:hypothetical protein
MSDSGDTMGSLLDSGPVVEPPDDPEDLEAPRVAIDIHPTADRDELAGQFAALLAAHTAEQKKLESRIEILEALRLTEKMAEAAEAASSASSAAAQSAAEAARLVKSAGEAVETAAAVMEVAREALKQISADGVIPDLLAEHCKSAACSARDTVLQALDECREDAEEFTEEVQQRAEQRATGKRGGKKR